MQPVTLERLEALGRFCDARGRYGNGRFAWCACMRWRMRSATFQSSRPEERRQALCDLVRQGTPVGVLAYVGGEPVGWCSVVPRSTYHALARSRVLPPVDDEAVWSIVCFFVNGRHRRHGLTGALLDGAIAYARDHGAPAREAYPVAPGERYGFMGSPAAFADAGFADVTPPQQARRVVRLRLSHP